MGVVDLKKKRYLADHTIIEERLKEVCLFQSMAHILKAKFSATFATSSVPRDIVRKGPDELINSENYMFEAGFKKYELDNISTLTKTCGEC